MHRPQVGPNHTPLTTPQPTVFLQRNVGSGAGEFPEAPSTQWNRRLELPFSFTVAARASRTHSKVGDYPLPLNQELSGYPYDMRWASPLVSPCPPWVH
jgi:hypothetical protein